MVPDAVESAPDAVRSNVPCEQEMTFAIALAVLSVLLGAVFLRGLLGPRRFIERVRRLMAGPGPVGAAAVRLLLAALLWFSAPRVRHSGHISDHGSGDAGGGAGSPDTRYRRHAETAGPNGRLAATRHLAPVRRRVGALRVHAMVGVVGIRRVLIRFVPAGPRSRGARFHPEGVTIMVTSIILLNVERTLVNDVAERLADRPEISEVYSVSGSYDLVAIVRVPHNDDLAKLVTEHLTQVGGITHTETMLAFRAYSRHDLEEMFAIGA